MFITPVFAAVEGIPLAAETIFELGPLAFTNSMLFGLITAAAVLWLMASAASRSSLRPRSRLAFYIETLLDFMIDLAADTFGNRKQAIKHVPFLLTLFIFILFSNLSGLIPGVGTVVTESGGHESPLLRAFTTDLNATLALAVLTIGSVQFYALRQLGLRGHLRHYFSNKPWHPMNFFIGVNEVFGEVLRIVTLSMRLFGVIYAGEVLLHAIGGLAGNFAWAATLPVMLLEIFFSLIQAYLFMMLTTVYLAMATAHSDEQHEPEIPVAASNPSRV